MISEEFIELNDFLSLLAFTEPYSGQWGKQDYTRAQKYDTIDMFNIKRDEMSGYDIKFYMDQYKKLYIDIGYYVKDQSNSLCSEIYLKSEKITIINPQIIAPFLEKLAFVASRNFQLQVPESILPSYISLVDNILKEEKLPDPWVISVVENQLLQVNHRYEEEKNFLIKLPQKITIEKLGLFEVHVELPEYMCRFVIFKSPFEDLPLLNRYARIPVFNDISVESEKKKLAKACQLIGHMPSPSIQKIYQYVMLDKNLNRNPRSHSSFKI